MDIKKLIRQKLDESNSENELVSKIRSQFPENSHLNTEYPITIEINNIKRKFLVKQKSLGRSARMGEGHSKYYLKTLSYGSLLKGDPKEHFWNFFEISEKGKFKEVGYPKYATKDEVEEFNKGTK